MQVRIIKDLLKVYQQRSRDTVQQLERYRVMFTAEAVADGSRRRGTQSVNIDNLDIDSVVPLTPITDNNYAYAYFDSFTAGIIPTMPKVTVKCQNPNHTKTAQARTKFLNKFFKDINFAKYLKKAGMLAAIEGHSFINTLWNVQTNSVDLEVVSRRRLWHDYTEATWERMTFAIRVHELSEAVVKEWIKLGLISNQNYNYVTTPDWILGYESTARHNDIRSVMRKAIIFEVYDFTDNKILYFNDTYRHIGTATMKQSLKDTAACIMYIENGLDYESVPYLQLVDAPLARLNEYDNLELWFNLANIAKTVINMAALQDPAAFLSAYTLARSPSDAIPATFNPGHDISTAITYTKTPTLGVDWRRSRASQEKIINTVLGFPEYERGVVGQTEIATEVALANEAVRTRTAQPVSIILETIARMAESIIRMYGVYGNDKSLARINSKYNMALTAAELFPDGVDESEFEYMPEAFNATTNSRSVFLNNFQKFQQLLTTSPFSNQAALMERVMQALEMDEVYVVPDPAQIPAGNATGAAPANPPGAETGDPMAAINALGMGNLKGGEMPAPEPTNPTSMRFGGPGNGRASGEA